MCDCAEQLERERQSPRTVTPQDSGILAAWGWGGAGKSWFPLLGGASLLALLALLYKGLGKMKALVWKTDSCTTQLVEKQFHQYKTDKLNQTFKSCKCKD